MSINQRIFERGAGEFFTQIFKNEKLMTGSVDTPRVSGFYSYKFPQIKKPMVNDS